MVNTPRYSPVPLRAAWLAVAALAACATGVVAQENYGEWAHYKPVIVNTKASGASVTQNVANFPLLVRLDSTHANIFNQAGSNGASVRFANAAGQARPYQIEHWDSAGKQAAIWVLADTIKGNDSLQALRLYWGKSGAADSSKGTAVFDSANGYRAVFHMNEASGDVFSAATLPITGTNVGTTTGAGISGPGRTFANPTNVDAGSQYINLGNPDALNFGGRVSFESWARWNHIRPSTGTSMHYRTLIYRHAATGASGAEAFLRVSTGNTNNEFYVTGRWTGSANIAALSPQIANAYGDSLQWVHLAGVYDSTSTTSRIWRLYRNGVQIAASTHNNAAGLPLGGNQWWIGRSTPTPRYFSGELDEVRISSVTRDSNHIRLNYETQRPGAVAVQLGATVSASMPPSGLAYTPDSAQYVLGTAVNLVPALTGAADSLTITPALPASLSFNKTNGAITGNVTAISPMTAYTVIAINAFGRDTASLKLAVVSAPPSALVYPVQTVSYTTTQPIAANVPTVTGTVDSFTVAPALPAGLNLNKTSGAISGTPTAAAAAANYVVTAVNASGSAKDTLNITVVAALADGAYTTWAQSKLVLINTRTPLVGPVTRYPLLVRLDSTNFNSGFAQAAPGGIDLRFTKLNNTVRLPHQIESWDATAKRAAVWVLVDSVRGNNYTNIRMHWGKAGVADSSSGARVFASADGYAAVFHMNEATGDVTDATSNAIIGANTGTTTTTGVSGPGRSFAGTNATNTNSATGRQYIALGAPAALDFGGKITMSAWVRWLNVAPTGSGTHYRTIINRDGSSPSTETFLRIGHTSGTVDQAQYAAGKYAPPDVFAQSPQQAFEYPDSAQWIHLVGTYDSTGPDLGLWRLYRNGAEIGVSVEDPNALLTTGATQWRIGRGPANNQQRYFSGDMDEIRISSVTRSPAQILLDYQTQRPGQTAVTLNDTVTPPVSLNGPRAASAMRADFTAKRLHGGLQFRVHGSNTAAFNLALVDMGGRVVWSQVNRQAGNAGEQIIHWDGSTRTGAKASAGIYGVRLTLLDAQGKITGTLERKVPFLR